MCSSYQELLCSTLHRNSKTLQYQHLGAKKLHSVVGILQSYLATINYFGNLLCTDTPKLVMYLYSLTIQYQYSHNITEFIYFSMTYPLCFA